MSAPASAWAIEQGRGHKLSTPERMVLVVLADRAACQKVCWPSQGSLIADTGLSLRSVRNAIDRLATVGLISLEQNIGKVTRYHVQRTVEPRQEVPGARPNGHDKTPAAHAGVQAPTPAPVASTQAPAAGDPGTSCPRTLKEPKKEPLVARASEPREAASGRRAEAAPSAAPSRRDQEAPPLVVGDEAPVDISAIVADVTASICGARSRPSAADPEPYAPIRRGPVEMERTVEQQQAILAAWIAEEALAKAPRVMEAAE